MKKLFTASIVMMLSFIVNAQLDNGSIAPDFTTTDLEGNEWHLYDILDQGKSVVIDLSATWCSPCWDFHQTGTMEQLWENYGPDGTDEVVVMTIEGDERTNIDCIYNLPGCNYSTWGNWLDGVNYPFINDDLIADLYDLSYWPTIYFICPNRQVREVSANSGPQAIYDMVGNCAPAAGENNAGIILYDSFEGAFCDQVTFSPKVKIQNLGTKEITELTVELMVDGEVEEIQDWSGSLATFQIADIGFAELNVSEELSFQIMVTSVNGMADDVDDNNMIEKSVYTIRSADNYVVLDLRTDDYPYETYWELVDGNGTALYSGGNPGIFGDQPTIEIDSYNASTNYTFNLPLPQDGCYSLNFYDFYGDGIVEYGGSYSLMDSEGNVILSGGDFEEYDEKPFQIEGATSVVENNAAIVLAQGLDQKFCEVGTLSPNILVQNVGANNVTSMVIEVFNSSETLSITNWTGDLASGAFKNIVLEEILVSESVMNIKINKVNGVDDDFDYKNLMQRDLDIPDIMAETNSLTLELELDEYGYEVYWQLEDFDGNVIASGGNTNVGPDGGGARTATASDPGAYGAFHQETIEITLSEGDIACYDFLMVDDWGDGLAWGPGGTYRLLDQEGNVLFQSVGQSYVTQRSRMEISRLVSAVENLDDIQELSLFPNPSSGMLNIHFDLESNTNLNIEVKNLLGQRVKLLEHRDFLAGTHRLTYPLNGVGEGLFVLDITDGKRHQTRRFVNQIK